MSQEEIEKYKQEITTRFEKATAENEKFGAVSLSTLESKKVADFDK